MKVPVYNVQGKKVSDMDLTPEMFEIQVNPNLVHEVVTIMRGNQRQVLAHTKTKGEVRGGGKKPWKQKGTGRARHGSIRSPLWRGGGITFGPRNVRNFMRKINKKAKRKALFMCLTDKVQNENFVVIDGYAPQKPNTKEADKFISQFCKENEKCLLVIPAIDGVTIRSMRNLQHVTVITANSVNVLELVKNKKVVILKPSLDVMKETFLAA